MSKLGSLHCPPQWRVLCWLYSLCLPFVHIFCQVCTSKWRHKHHPTSGISCGSLDLGPKHLRNSAHQRGPNNPRQLRHQRHRHFQRLHPLQSVNPRINIRMTYLIMYIMYIFIYCIYSFIILIHTVIYRM